MAGKFEVYKDKAGEFRFRLKAANGQVVLTSQGYKGKPAAMNGIKSTTANSKDEKFFDKTQTKNGGFRFNLKAKNHQVIGTSQTYKSASGRDNGVAAVARAADGAAVDDQTAG